MAKELGAQSDSRLEDALDYASNIGVLGVLRALSRLRGLVLLPIIAKGLGPGIYGAWTQSLVAVNLGSSIIDFQLHSAVVRFVAGTEDRAEQRAVFLPSLLLISGLGVLVAVGAAFARDAIAGLVLGDPQFRSVGAILGIWIGLTAVTQLGLHLLRGLQRVKLYGFLSTGQVLAQLVAVAVVITVTGELLPAVWSAIGVELLFAILVLAIGLGQIGLAWPGWRRLRGTLAFSLPLVPAYYSGAVLGFADRLVVAAQLGSTAVGIYAAAYSLARIVRELFVPIGTALMPAVTRMWDSEDVSRARWILGNTVRYYAILAVPALVGLVLLGPTIMQILATQTMAAGVRLLIPFIGLGLMVTNFQNAFSFVLQIAEDTRSLAVSRLIAAGGYVLLVLFAIPRWGLLGGAIATSLGYILDLLLTRAMARRHLRFPLPLRDIAKAIVASAVMVPVVINLNRGGFRGVIFALAGGLATYTFAMVLLRAVGRRELRFAGSLLGMGGDVGAQ